MPRNVFRWMWDHSTVGCATVTVMHLSQKLRRERCVANQAKVVLNIGSQSVMDIGRGGKISITDDYNLFFPLVSRQVSRYTVTVYTVAS